MLLSELVAIEHLQCDVVACPDAFEREIRWVYMTELRDPAPYLRGGEMVITNGLWRGRGYSSATFIEILRRSGVCGVGYGLGPVTSVVPRDLAAACEAVELPLFAIHDPVSFSDISEAFTAHHVQERQSALLQAVRRNRALVEAIAGGSDANGLLSILARDYAISPSLHDHAGKLLAATGRAPSPSETAAVADAIQQREALPGIIPLDNGEDGLLCDVQAEGTDAYLLCREGALSAEARAAIHETLTFLRLGFAQHAAVHALEIRFAAELIELIMAGASHRLEVAARIRAFGLDPDGPLAVIAVSIPEEGTDRRRVIQTTTTFLRSRGVAAIGAEDATDTIAIVAWNGSESRLREAAVDLAGALAADADRVSVGVGLVSGGCRLLKRSLLEARVGSAFGLTTGNRVEVVSHGELASYRLLLALQDDHIHDAFRTLLIEPLVEHDALHHSQLLQTLAAFLSSNGKWQATADKLHIHVNTLRHRLRRIEMLTGRGLDKMDDRVDLYLALNAIHPVSDEGQVSSMIQG